MVPEELPPPRSTTGEALHNIYRELYSHFGPQGWWPGDTADEICIGAILTQNTNWQNVAKAIARLKQAELLDLRAVSRIPVEILADLIRPAGYYNIKARRLLNFTDALFNSFPEGLPQLFSLEMDQAREFLLSVKGIGPETADSILLYAGSFPTFVVDAYTVRVLSRHDFVDETITYEEARALFMEHLPHDTSLFNEYHALFVALGKNYCKKRLPSCDRCPLKGR